MGQTILVNATKEETRMALLEQGELTEIAVERLNCGNIVGNIYKGKIKNVLPGMQAAFIDIGADKNAYLYIGDLAGRAGKNRSHRHKTLTVGQDIMVQISKDALGSKGPRATTRLTLPGRYVVFMPTVEYTGISHRVESDAERRRLKNLAEKIRPPGTGLVIRTVAEGRNEKDISRDVKYLDGLWNSLLARFKRAAAPTLLYRDVELVIRIVRDYLTDEVNKFVLDNREAYGRVVDLLQYTSPELVKRVELYEGPEDIFTFYGLEEELYKLEQRQIWLKCGGYLIIDKTEALTVIDVNTGKFVGRTNLADTVFQTNREAAVEIARQLRLRDIGGIIIVDFIDMDKEEHRQKVLEVLEAKLKQDRTKSAVLGLTKLGLVEITRKKARQNFDSVMYADCPYCHGRGKVKSPQTVIIDLRRRLRELTGRARNSRGSFVVQVHPQVAAVLADKQELAQLERDVQRSIEVEAVAAMHPESFSVLHKSD